MGKRGGEWNKHWDGASKKSFQRLTFIVRFVESVAEARNTTIGIVLANWADPVYKGRCRGSYSNFQKLCGQVKRGGEGGIAAIDLTTTAEGVVMMTTEEEQGDQDDNYYESAEI